MIQGDFQAPNWLDLQRLHHNRRRELSPRRAVFPSRASTPDAPNPESRRGALVAVLPFASGVDGMLRLPPQMLTDF